MVHASVEAANMSSSSQDMGFDSSEAASEAELSARFSLRRALETLRPRMVLLSLHWSGQTRPVLEVSRQVRAWWPDATIVLGGLTASAFATEIVASEPGIEAVVQGDGEEPGRPIRRLRGHGGGPPPLASGRTDSGSADGACGTVSTLVPAESGVGCDDNRCIFVADHRYGRGHRLPGYVAGSVGGNGASPRDGGAAASCGKS